MSKSGPSGRGVNSPSQAPHSQRALDRSAWNASTSAVLPIPDSPDDEHQPAVALACLGGVLGQRVQERRPLQ